MSYFKILGLEKEPFSTSPDPAFFYLSKAHKAILYKLKIAVRLKRGLSLVLGNVGTGKTTLARRFFQVLMKEDKETVLFHMILNPIHRSERGFLLYLTQLFQIELNSKRPSAVDCMRKIEEHLFQKGVEEKRTIILIVDEAQKFSDTCLETLRTLLNYETNEYKLLQLILMGQMELLPKIKKLENFWDRIGLKYGIGPLDRQETEEMINFRLREASQGNSCPALFEDQAIDEIYNYSGGYPRKITMLCHRALEDMVMKSGEFVNRAIVCELIEKELKLVGV
ncbi:MAG: AAA family ATPase [Candidatus Omnitrophota bacterium]|nr:AAA family ATPase [Candidatus Omnitrophota bacterium]